jgi:hypothetical protein
LPESRRHGRKYEINFRPRPKLPIKNVSAKDLDSAAMGKIVDMLEPAQVASYREAQKYGPGK